MNNCIFCNIDFQKLENTLIEETKYFYITASKGSLTNGYLLIISKKHCTSFSKLSFFEKTEYFKIIKKYRKKLKDIYGKYPLIFEHGTPNTRLNSSSSVVHAHTHIVNHFFKDENKILKELNFKKIKRLNNTNKNYIFFINNKGNYFITYNFKPISQLMRKLIAQDLNIGEKYNWHKDMFLENIQLTINKFKL